MQQSQYTRAKPSSEKKFRPGSKTGFRNASAAGFEAAELVKAYDSLGADDRFSRGDGLAALPYLQQNLDISTGAYSLLSALAGMTRDQDWAHGDALIVWPSNETLMQLLKCSLRTVQTWLRELRDVRLITFRDNPRGGHRYGNRDPKTGRLKANEAYGIDLRPFAMRIGELTSAQDAFRGESKAVRALRRRARSLLNDVIGKLATVCSDRFGEFDLWDRQREVVAEAEALLEVKFPDRVACEQVLELLTPIEVEVSGHLQRLFRKEKDRQANRMKKTAPQGAADCTHITTTESRSSNEDSVRPVDNHRAAMRVAARYQLAA